MPYNKNLRIIQSWLFHRKSHIYKNHGKHSLRLHAQNRRKTGISGAQWCVFSKEKTCLEIKLKAHSMCTKQCGQMSCSWGKRQFRAKGTCDRPRRWAGGWSCGDRHGGSWSGAACDERSWKLCPGAPAAWWASRHRPQYVWVSLLEHGITPEDSIQEAKESIDADQTAGKVVENKDLEKT